MLELIKEIRDLWGKTFSPHFLPKFNEEFLNDLDQIEIGIKKKDSVKSKKAIEKWYQWTLAKTFHTNVSGPSLAYFDLKDLLKKLRDLIKQKIL